MGKKTPQTQDDARFDKVYTDPKFVSAPNKLKKVEIDQRFKKMFTEKQFNVIAKVDKYGRKIDAVDNFALQNYYAKEEKPQLSKLELTGKKFYDDEGNFEWQGESSSSAEQESSEAEQTYSDEVSGVWSLSEQEQPPEIQQDQPVTKRIAVTNLDWDSISATDLFVLFTGFCHQQGHGGVIEKV